MATPQQDGLVSYEFMSLPAGTIVQEGFWVMSYELSIWNIEFYAFGIKWYTKQAD